MPQNTNGHPRKSLPVRKNTPKPERTPPKVSLHPENYHKTRTGTQESHFPFGKTPQNPNGLPRKSLPVRENAQKPERSPRKVTLRSEKHPEIRTDSPKSLPSSGEIPQIPDGIPKKSPSVRKNAPKPERTTQK